MITLSYHFKCDVPNCNVESVGNLGAMSHRMHIPDYPIPQGWHYLDHKIVCNGHSVIVDKKWVDAPVKHEEPVKAVVEESWEEVAVIFPPSPLSKIEPVKKVKGKIRPATK